LWFHEERHEDWDFDICFAGDARLPSVWAGDAYSNRACIFDSGIERGVARGIQASRVGWDDPL
jgi:hypothetical protein